MTKPKTVQPIKITDRYAHIPDTGSNWRFIDNELDGQEFHIPKKFAALPETAIELLEYITCKQQIAMNAGYSNGRKSLQYDLRRLLGVNPANSRSVQ